MFHPSHTNWKKTKKQKTKHLLPVSTGLFVRLVDVIGFLAEE